MRAGGGRGKSSLLGSSGGDGSDDGEVERQPSWFGSTAPTSLPTLFKAARESALDCSPRRGGAVTRSIMEKPLSDGSCIARIVLSPHPAANTKAPTPAEESLSLLTMAF